MSSHYTVPGLSDRQGAEVAAMLQTQLSRYNDLHLTLKHVHWNVIGPNFIAVHQMIDPQVSLVRGYADEVAERIATLGGSPRGTADAIINEHTWTEYPHDRDCADVHLAAGRADDPRQPCGHRWTQPWPKPEKPAGMPC
jgi:starvation-inducible DNA-binding protein